MSPIKVIVANDHDTFVQMMCLIIKSIINVDELTAATDENELEELLKTETFHLVLLNIWKTNANGFATANSIREKYPNIKIIGLTMPEDNLSFRKAYTADFHGCLTKNANEETIKKAIETVIEGKKSFFPGGNSGLNL